METKVICKELQICLEKLPLSSFEKKESCLKNMKDVDFSNEIKQKKRVSFNEQSSVFYYSDDHTSILQGNLSESFDSFNNSMNEDNYCTKIDASHISCSEDDIAVIFEKVPLVFLEDHASRYNIHHNEHSQRIKASCSALPNENEPELKVLIERLPDNLFEMHCNNLNKHIPQENKSCFIPPVDNSKIGTESSKHHIKYKGKVCKKKNQKIKSVQKQKPMKELPTSITSDTHQHMHSESLDLVTCSANFIESENMPFNGNTNGEIPLINIRSSKLISDLTVTTPENSLLNESFKSWQSYLSEASFDGTHELLKQDPNKYLDPFNKQLCVHLERLEAKKIGTSEYSLGHNLPLNYDETINETNCNLLSTNCNSNSEKNAALHVKSNNFQNEMNSECHTANTQDFVPLSCSKTVNYNVDSLALPLSEIHSSVSDDSSEDDYPLSNIEKNNSQKTSLLANLHSKRDKNCINFLVSDKITEKVNMNHANSLNHQNKTLGTSLPNIISVDHNYHLPLKSKSVPTGPPLIPKISKKNKLKNKDNALKVKKQKNKNIMISANTAFQKKRSDVKLNLKKDNAVHLRKSSHKKKKWNKNAVRKKQMKVYEMIIKYLHKELNGNRKSSKKAKKGKNSLIRECKVSQVQSNEPESSTTSVEINTQAACAKMKSCITRKTSATSGKETELAPEANCHDSIYQNKRINQQKNTKENIVDKYRLGFLAKNSSLRFYNKCFASERLLLSKCKIKKRKRLIKMFKNLRKVCHISKV